MSRPSHSRIGSSAANVAAKGPSCILLVGDTNFLLFYRLAYTVTGVVITFLYDLKVCYG